MPSENLEIVTRAFDAFSRGDIEMIAADLAPNFAFHPSGRFVDTDPVYTGRDGFAKFLGAFRSAWKDLAIGIEHIQDLGDGVLTLGYFHGHGAESGAEIRAQGAWLHTMKDGQVVRLDSFSSWAEGLAAADLGTMDGRMGAAGFEPATSRV